MEYEEDKANLEDPEMRRWFSEAEIEIIKNALVKTATGEELTVVEDVMWREYTMKLRARRQAEEARKSAERGLDEGRG
jgi:hypothetical protein